MIKTFLIETDNVDQVRLVIIGASVRGDTAVLGKSFDPHFPLPRWGSRWAPQALPPATQQRGSLYNTLHGIFIQGVLFEKVGHVIWLSKTQSSS